MNQRALIDKVLARYSGEFTGAFSLSLSLANVTEELYETVFRELLQNSDDASSKAVEIHFDTEAYVKSQAGTAQDAAKASSSGVEKLPDMKTAVVGVVMVSQ